MDRWNIRKFFSGKNLTWLLLLLVLLFNFSIRSRLRDLPLERDEGEYAYAGQLILQGIPPYQIAWNMKFPGAYYAYACLMKLFGQSPAGIHEGLILVTSLSILLIFLMGRELTDDAGSLLAAAFFAQLCNVPLAYGLAGHATHFVVFFVNLGAYALLKLEKSRPSFWAFVSGLAFGSAILMKQHAVFFSAVAVGWLLWFGRSQRAPSLRHLAIFFGGTIFPLLLMFLLLVWAGVWNRFYLWTIRYASEYVSLLSLGTVPRQFAAGFGPVLGDGVWVWCVGLAGALLVFLPGPGRRPAAFGAALLLAGLAATVPGFYFRGHYFLMAMPGLALVCASALYALAGRLRRHLNGPILRLATLCPFLLVSGDLVLRNAPVWFAYTPFQVCRLLYGRNPFPESLEIARYLAAHTRPEDTVAVIGSEPQIYFLSGRHAATGYLYLYPLTEPQPLADKMRADFIQEIESNRPAYIVYVNLSSSWVSTLAPARTRSLEQAIIDWWRPYAGRNYVLVGQIDIPPAAPTQFFWDEQMTNRTSVEPATISVFRRK